MKNKTFLAAAIVLVIAVSGTVLYLSYRPHVEFLSMKTTDTASSSYMELVTVGYSYKSERFLPKDFGANVSEFGKKNQEVYQEYTERYKMPMNVRAKIEIKSGQTVVTYYGTVTTQDGQTEEYDKQLVFDFVLTREIPDVFQG